MKEPIYLSLGSNLGDREANLRAAVERLRAEIDITSVSSIYETEPVGVTDQPPFLNLVIAARTELEPTRVLEIVKRIEREVGRTPTFRWGPRVVDIDILLYGDRTIQRPDLVVPHERMHERAFVLIPLAEIAPDTVHPVLNSPVSRRLDSLPPGSGVRLYRRF